MYTKYQSRLLNNIPHVVHGFSTRHDGDMRMPAARRVFLKELGIDEADFRWPEQTHGTGIAVLKRSNGISKIPLVDGLVTKSGISSVYLGIHVADCVPLMAVDPKHGVIGVSHAGWRGTLGGIAQNMVRDMRAAGADVNDIRVFIGPHIGMCCYSVPEERADRFRQTFRDNEKVVISMNDTWYVDIGYANYLALCEAGIEPDQIDRPVTCTSCQADTFYSYRKDTKDTFGEILGVIGFSYGN